MDGDNLLGERRFKENLATLQDGKKRGYGEQEINLKRSKNVPAIPEVFAFFLAQALRSSSEILSSTFIHFLLSSRHLSLQYRSYF